MGQNSTEVAYGFGQLGSAYTDKAQPIIPPQGMVIIAIQFLADSTPTALVSEKLDTRGPGYVSISGSLNDHVDAADLYMNFNGFTSAACTGSNSGNDVTISAANTNIQVGQYVLIVNDDADESGATAMTIDSETAIPIYNGPNKQGVKVTAYSGTTVTLSTATTPTSSQSLIFLGPQQGAGGITAASQQYPKGAVIYGRWTHFVGENDKGVICYFGH